MKITLTDEAATRDFGAALGLALQKTSPWYKRHFCIGLEGDLGAGKTTLTDALVRSLGIAEGAQSPTYALVNCYNTRTLNIWHLDLYRTSGVEDLLSMGLDQYEGAGNLWLVEWINLAEDHIECDLHIRLEYDELQRIAHLQALHKGSKIILQTLQRKIPHSPQ